MLANINKELCTKCGGKCCKESGCIYFVNDFSEINEEIITELLNTNRVSIASDINFELVNNQIKLKLILYLRSRNINRDIVDLISLKTQCFSLLEDGCYWNDLQRPGSGKSLIPNSKGNCHQSHDLEKEISAWLPYQDLLIMLAQKYSGMSIEEKIRYDIEELFYEFATSDLKNISLAELVKVATSEPILIDLFPLEYVRSRLRIQLEFQNQNQRKLLL